MSNLIIENNRVIERIEHSCYEFVEDLDYEVVVRDADGIRWLFVPDDGESEYVLLVVVNDIRKPFVCGVSLDKIDNCHQFSPNYYRIKERQQCLT